MAGQLLPAGAVAFATGLLAWPLIGRFAPAWGWLVLGAAGSIGALVASPAGAGPMPAQIALRAGADDESPITTALRGDDGDRPGALGVVALIVVALALFGIGWAGVAQARLQAGVLVRTVPASVRLEASLRTDPTPGPYGWSAIADVGVLETDDRVVVVRERVWISGSEPIPAGLERGDRVAIEGALEVPDDLGFRTALHRRGIGVLVSAGEVRRLGPSDNVIIRAAQSFRNAARRSFRALLPQREAGLLMGLALGDDADLDPALERDFDAAGLGHLLVASGGNVVMVLAPALWFAGLLRLPPKARFVLGVGVVSWVVLVTGGEPSVLRAGVMAGFGLLGAVSGRPRSGAALVGGAVLTLLVLDPWLVWSIGFQLSVAATVGLVALATPIADRLSLLPHPLALAAGTTLAAQLGVTPVLLFHFREVPGTTVAANLAAFGLVAPSMLLGSGAAAAHLVWEPLGRAIVPFALVPIRGLEFVADRSAKAPIPTLASGGGVPVLVLGTVAVLAIAWRLRSGRRFSRTAVLCAIVIAPTFAWWVALGAGPPDDGLEVRFFDVGQGDAALVSSPGGARVLIDGGPDTDEVATDLATLGVRRLDLVVASHPHADHIVGLPAVLARFKVGTVLEPGCPDQEGALRPQLLDAIADEHVPIRHPRAGAAYVVGDMRIDVLSPVACFSGTESDLNNDALVLRVAWRGRVVLFATEPEEPAQEAMLEAGVDLRADVLKVPHHGAATSVPEFFQAVDAATAIVSVGENSYGHPVPSTLDAIEATGAQVWRTDEHGDITVTLGGQGPVSVVVER
ncbi:MAG: ComEC/Rec2 family competence protein [Actinomycetota bacterium]